MTELIEHLLHTQPVDQSGSHRSESVDHFIRSINDQISSHSRISPFSHPAFFTYFYLGSLFTLNKAGLTQKLGVEDLWYKVKGDDRIILAYKKKFGPMDEQLAIRLVENGASEESEVRLTDMEMKELISKSMIDLASVNVQGLQENIDYEIVRYDHEEEKYVHSQIGKTEVLDQLERVEKLGAASLSVSDTFDKINAEPISDPVFEGHLDLIHSELPKVVQSSAEEIINSIRKSFLEHENKPFIDDHFKQSGFVAGALTLNFKERFNFDCFINEPNLPDKKILLNMVSKSTTLDGWKTNIPVVIESSDRPINERTCEERFQYHTKNGGLEMHPAMQNDRRSAAYVLFNINDQKVHSDHMIVKPYRGIVDKIMDHNQRWTQDGGVDHVLLERDLKREIEYAYHELNLKDNPSALHNMILGQVISANRDDVNERHRFNYLSDSAGDEQILKESVKSYLISTQDGKRLININLIDLPKAEKIIKLFTGDHFMMFPVGDRSQYSLINVNLLQDQHGKVNIITSHQKIDTKPYEEQYSLLKQEGSIPENEAFMKFSADEKIMFRGYMEDIMSSWHASSLDYSLHQLIVSGSENELREFIHQTWTNHRKFVNTKQDLLALMKGAIMKDAQLLHPPSRNQNALVVKKVRQEDMDEDMAYEIEDDHSMSDAFEPVILLGTEFKQTYQSPQQCIENIAQDLQQNVYSDLEMSSDEHTIVMAAVINKDTEIIDEMVTVKSIDSLVEQTSEHMMETDNFDMARCFTRRRKRNAACQLMQKNVEKLDIVSQEGHLNKQNLVRYLEHERNRQQAEAMIDYIGHQVDKQGLPLELNLESKFKTFMSESKVAKKLNKIGRMGHFVTQTFMLKNMAADIAHKNWEGLAINGGFIIGGHLSFMAADQTEKFALKLMANNKMLAGRILRATSPFVARLTGVYNVYDLYQSVKAYKAGSQDALVGIVNDATFLAVDVMEIGAALADGAGLLAGASAVAGPVGTAIAALVFVATDIYTSVEKVNELDKAIHLTANEKMDQGLRSFFGMGLDEHMLDMENEKSVNEELVRQKMNLLIKSDIDFYIFSIEQGYSDPKFQHNRIFLEEKDKSKVCWNRAKPENVPDNLTLSCFTHTDIIYEKVDLTGAYISPFNIPMLPISAPVDLNLNCQKRLVCENAIGISKKGEKSAACKTLIEMGDGTDYVKGEPQCHNTFLIGNGGKVVHGGQNGNTFILRSNITTGIFMGNGAQDTLDLSDFAPNYTPSIDVHIEPAYSIQSKDKFNVINVFDVIGRRGKPDRIRCHCSTSFVNGNGATEKVRDFITLPESTNCFYNMTIMLSNHLKVINRAQHGEVKFLVNDEPGKMTIVFANSSHTKNIFLFNFDKSELTRIEKLKGKVVLHTTNFTLTLVRLKLHTAVFKFLNDGSELKIDRYSQHSLVIRSRETDARWVINQYRDMAEKLSVFVTVFLEKINQTVFIGHSNKAIISKNNHHAANVIPNDPDHMSHLCAGKTSAIFQINFNGIKETSKAVIYTSHEQTNYVKTIDFKPLSQALPEVHALDIEISTNNLDIQLNVIHKIANRSQMIGAVILENALPWYTDFQIIRNQAPLRIKLGQELNLVPVPLVVAAEVNNILIDPKDVEPGMEIIIQKNAKTLSFFKYAESLIVTDYVLFKSSETNNPDCAQKWQLSKLSWTMTRLLTSLMCPSFNNQSSFNEDSNSDKTTIVLRDYFTVSNYQNSRIIVADRSFDLNIEKIRSQLLPYNLVRILQKLRFNRLLRNMIM